MLIGPGRVVLVVGPSGAGKDAVIGETRRLLMEDRRFLFPRRIVTRAPNAAEDHDTLSATDFEASLRSGAFALHWQVHGLHYGISVEIDDAVRRGGSVVFNASRRIVPLAKARYRHAGVVLIDAAIDIRRQRLAARDRETPAGISARLERVVADFSARDADLVIDNSGALDRAADELTAWLLSWPSGS
jgi:ribose 1,5-bisphosphokinase